MPRPQRVRQQPARSAERAIASAAHPASRRGATELTTSADPAEASVERVRAARQNPGRIPEATYRLQFNRDFNFRQAAEIVAYLHDLGISDVYASPLFRAGAESTHGYDVCDFGEFNPLLGGGEGFEQLSSRLHQLGLGLLLDMVPNHMGADLSNHWWLDVLEKGRSSQYAPWFDIDWRPLRSDLHDKVLLPVLEDHYAKVLEQGKLRMVFNEGGFSIAYYDRRFPLSPGSYPRLLQSIVSSSASISEGMEELQPIVAQAPALCSEASGLASLKQHLRRLYESSAQFRGRLESLLERLNGRRGDPRSFDELDQLLRHQHYRLAFWRVGPEEINYRRFFDITDLVSLRMELPEVFESSHRLIERLLRQKSVTGLRIDHPDGLWNPKQYFERLQAVFGAGSAPLYVVAEKILTGEESLPPDWPVAGTTGYDFLNWLNGIFIHRAHGAAFDALCREFTGLSTDFSAALYAGKMKILRQSLIGELNGLAQRLKAIAVSTRSGQDLTFRQLHSALAEIIACFPVYRTYVAEETAQLAPVERDYIIEAVQTATARNPGLDVQTYHFIQRMLLLDWPAELSGAALHRCRNWVMKFQQLSGPVMAKGLEDTAFYNFNRFVSLNEVGGHPGAFGGSVRVFHEYSRRQSESWPHSLLATATHDTKRGEDLRARLNVLSEMPGEWRRAIWRWSEMNADKKSVVDGSPAPHPNDEYLFYQTLVGAWLPDSETPEGLASLRARLAAYLRKAIKEAKARTSWTNPNSAYEEATRNFVESVLSDGGPDSFLADFKVFQRKVAFFGIFNSLSQVLLKLTSPGVPDFYQGTELWDFNLVDPDNRRPVDYPLRRHLLADIQARAAESSEDLRPLVKELLEQPETGAVKLYLIWRTLQWRRAHAELFRSGEYVPLQVTGNKREHACAFARSTPREQIITVVPRLVLTLTGGANRPPVGLEIWGDAELVLPNSHPGQGYQNILTGERLTLENATLPLAQALSTFPVALLERTPK